MDDRYIYIGFMKGNIKILNRWTRECIKNIDWPDFLPSEHLNCLQLSERHLATKSNNGTIVIYDLATFEQTQILHSNSEPRSIRGRFCITSDILVNLKVLDNDTSAVLSVRKFNHETGLYGTSEMARAEFDWSLFGLYQNIYCWKKYIIVDSSYLADDSKLFERRVIVIDMKSLKQVRKITFTEPSNICIKRECHDGIIVSFEGNCRVTWNVEKNIVQPITQHSSFPTSVGRVYLARMDHHSDY